MNKVILSNRDIIVVGQQPWDTEIGSNCKNIAMEFSKNNRVLYINAPLDRITKFKSKNDKKVQTRVDVIHKVTDGLTQVNDNMWSYYPDELIESINWIKSDFIYNRLNKINNKRFARSIRKAIKRIGFKNFILFNDNDIFRSFYLKELLNPALTIYYSRDYLLSVDYWKLHGQVLEPLLIKKSDLCLANSVYLANYCKQYNDRSYYVGQGCDLEIFAGKQDLPRPGDILHLEKPLIGYVGALQSLRLNIDLLEQIALKRPDWNIVLVGPEDDQFKLSRLHNIKNIHFLGSKIPELLPAYINSFDVCINPQVINQVTIGNYPRKIDEYLAMGKPIVATRTEAMVVFEQHTYLAETEQNYIELVSKALSEDSEAKRQARISFAATHSWENNVGEIYKAIVEFEEGTD